MALQTLSNSLLMYNVPHHIYVTTTSHIIKLKPKYVFSMMQHLCGNFHINKVLLFSTQWGTRGPAECISLWTCLLRTFTYVIRCSTRRSLSPIRPLMHECSRLKHGSGKALDRSCSYTQRVLYNIQVWEFAGYQETNKQTNKQTVSSNHTAWLRCCVTLRIWPGLHACNMEVLTECDPQRCGLLPMMHYYVLYVSI